MKFYPTEWVIRVGDVLRRDLRNGDSDVSRDRAGLAVLEDLLPRIEDHLVDLIDRAAVDNPALAPAKDIVRQGLR
jgi:hypothetical protein